jgi:hypothetical protein
LTKEGFLSATKSVNWRSLSRRPYTSSIRAPWNFVLSGDVGGFGVGSQFSWQALAFLENEMFTSSSATWSAMVGYKALNATTRKAAV